MNKVIRDGKVAVLISPSFGAGWSTWGSDKHRDFLLFDSGLVSLAENKASDDEVKSYLTEKLGKDHGHYCGGWRDIEIVWLDVGTEFSVEEYDGNESLRFRESETWSKA